MPSYLSKGTRKTWNEFIKRKPVISKTAKLFMCEGIKKRSRKLITSQQIPQTICGITTDTTRCGGSSIFIRCCKHF
ncbi:hypothetical protein Bhyg_04216, partial [Pseudolycoriella hygida]